MATIRFRISYLDPFSIFFAINFIRYVKLESNVNLYKLINSSNVESFDLDLMLELHATTLLL